MQDIHSIGPGGGGGGDRRLRSIAGAALSHHLIGGHNLGAGFQALKCPRCDSLNTKFCYYNNYNLSQPRHFCKSCRRYWTKGGVLRNVPVGGGCRKSKSSSKRSSSAKQNSSPSSPPAADPPPPAPSAAPASNSHSSSESSGLTGFNSLVFEGGPPLFPDIGGLSDLMTSPSSESALTSFGFNNNSLLLGHGQEQEQQVKDGGGGGGSFGPLDWQGSGGGVPVDHGLFDLPTVDQAYWSQSQWTIGDHDHTNLYLP